MDSAFEQVGDVRIHYLHGGAGAPLVLLHGGLLNAEKAVMRDPYEPAVTSRHRVIVPEMRGHGQTINPDGDLSYQELARDIIELSRALDLERPAIWGFSDGANVALEVGLQAPDLPSALVLHAAETTWSGASVKAAREFFFIPEEGPPDTERFATAQPGFASFLGALHTSQGPDHWRTLITQSYRMWTTPIDYGPDVLATVTAPTLVACGDRDDFLDVPSQVELAAGIPTSELAIFPGLAHDFLRTGDVAVVLEFLDRRLGAKS
jgi:pimeloyl-ACP methyl ester carboxylesterase